MQGTNVQMGKCTSEFLSASHLASPLQPYLSYVSGDLQQELAHLRSHVFPHLDSLCLSRGTFFRPVDIQHTQNEEDDDLHLRQAIGKVHFQQKLKISLDLINTSSTFLCLLGHHHGCVSSEDGVSPPPCHPEGEPSCLSEVEQNLQGAARGGYSWVMDEKHRACSIIELEIIQAAFMGKPTRCFFYFKDCTPQSDEDDDIDSEVESQMALFRRVLSGQRPDKRQQLWNLKSKIINHLLPVRFFRDLQELEDLVIRDWRGILDELHPLTEQHPVSAYLDSCESGSHESHIQALCHVFVPSTQTAETLESLDKFVFPLTHKVKAEPYSNPPAVQFTRSIDNRESEKSILLLSGERGSGKSSLAAWWLQEFRKRNPRFSVVPYFCGTSTPSKDIRFMLRHCTAKLRKVFYGDMPEWTEVLEDSVEPRPLLREVQAFTAAVHLGPCVLLLDGLDCLTETLGLSLREVKELRWLPVTLPSHCKLIVTTTTADLTYKSLTSRLDVQVISWPGLSDPCVQYNILRRHLSLPSKDFPGTLLQRVIRRKLCRLPAVLTLLSNELRTCGMERDEQEETELLEEYVEVDSISELWVKVIRRWVLDYSTPSEDPTPSSKETGPSTVPPRPELRGWVWDTLCLIHVSRSGLTEVEILALLKNLGYCGPLRVQALEWARLRSVFGLWVREKPDGLLYFTHQSLSQAVELLLLGVTDPYRSRLFFHNVLAGFFQRPGGGPRSSIRKLEELPWHLAQTGKFWELQNVLTHPADMELLADSVSLYPQLRADVVPYWTLLSEKGHDPTSSLQRLLGFNGSTNGCGLPCLGTVGNLALLSSDILLCLGKSVESEKILLQTEATLQQAGELDGDSRRSLLKVQHMLVKLYIDLHQLAKAETYCDKGLETARMLTDSIHNISEDIRLIKAQLLCSLCQMALKRGRLDSVTRILREISDTGLMSVHPCAEDTITLLQGMQKVCLGEVSAAETCFQAALATRRRQYGSDHPLVAIVEEQLADIWADSIHTDKDWTQRRAAELYRHVIRVRQAVVPCRQMTTFLPHPSLQDLINTLLKLSKLLLQSPCRADRREALSLQQRAADLSQLLSSGHPPTKHAEDFLNTDAVMRRPVINTAATATRSSLTGGLLTEYQPLQEQPQASSRARATPRHPQSASSQRAVLQKPKTNVDKTQNRPTSAIQTTMFGPQSDIQSLLAPPVPRLCVCGRGKTVSRESSIRIPLPIRCFEQEEAVKALNRQMGTSVHRKPPH